MWLKEPQWQSHYHMHHSYSLCSRSERTTYISMCLPASSRVVVRKARIPCMCSEGFFRVKSRQKGWAAVKQPHSWCAGEMRASSWVSWREGACDKWMSMWKCMLPQCQFLSTLFCLLEGKLGTYFSFPFGFTIPETELLLIHTCSNKL